MARRAQLPQRIYLYLAAAIAGFAAIECFLFATGLALPIADALLGTAWLLVLVRVSFRFRKRLDR